MKKIHLILSGSIILIGIVHVVFSTTMYDDLNFNALWFVGGGFYLITLGLQNISANTRTVWNQGDRTTLYISNLLTVIFISMGIYVMRDIQTSVISVIITFMTVSCFLLAKDKS